VLRIPLLTGRNFTRADASRNVVLLNETASRKFFSAENPVGKAIDSNDKKWEVVGIAKDTYITDLDAIQPTLYWPITGSFGVPELLADSGAAVKRSSHSYRPPAGAQRPPHLHTTK
jgi:MacB-like periplasmic core domain